MGVGGSVASVDSETQNGRCRSQGFLREAQQSAEHPGLAMQVLASDPKYLVKIPSRCNGWWLAAAIVGVVYDERSAMHDQFHWARILAFVTGLVNQELLLCNEYLAAENRIL